MPEVVLQHYGGGNFIHQGLVTPLLFLQSHFQHGPAGKFGGEALVHPFDWNCGEILLQFYYELLYHRSGMCVGIIEVLGVTDDDALYCFSAEIIFEKRQQLPRLHGCQSRGDNLKWIGDCKAGALLSVIYRDDSGQ